MNLKKKKLQAGYLWFLICVPLSLTPRSFPADGNLPYIVRFCPGGKAAQKESKNKEMVISFE